MKYLRPLLVGALALALVAGLSACSSSDDSDSTEDTAVAATVNGTDILESTVQDYIASFRASDETLETDDGWAEWLETYGYTEDTLRETVIEYFIKDELIREAADDAGITLDSDAIDEQIESVKSNYDTDADWEDALAASGYTEEEYRDALEISALAEDLQASEVATPTPTDEEIQEYVNSNASSYEGKKSSQILFSSDDEETAKEVLAQLQDGADFATLAEEYSTDSVSAADGGNVGWDCLNSFVTEYTDALDELDEGEMSGLVQSDYGYHIILCTDVYTVDSDATTVDLDTVPDEILEYLTSSLTDELYSEAFDDYVQALYDAADITINPNPYASEETSSTSTDTSSTDTSSTSTSDTTSSTDTSASE